MNDEGSKSDALTLNEPERGSSGVDKRGGAPNGLLREGAATATGAGATTGAGAGAGATTGAGAVAPCRMKGFVTAGVGATGITGGGTGFPNGFPADVGETDVVDPLDERETIGANELTSTPSYLSARAAQIPCRNFAQAAGTWGNQTSAPNRMNTTDHILNMQTFARKLTWPSFSGAISV